MVIGRLECEDSFKYSGIENKSLSWICVGHLFKKSAIKEVFRVAGGTKTVEVR